MKKEDIKAYLEDVFGYKTASLQRPKQELKDIINSIPNASMEECKKFNQ